MHELSIALSIIEGVTEELQERGAPKLHAVHLQLGNRSGVVRESLLFAYDVACEGTPLAGSRLVIAEAEGTSLQITGLEIDA